MSADARLAQAAQAYCALLEPHPVADPRDWRASVFAALAELYSAAVLHPGADAATAAAGGADIAHDRWREVHAFAAAQLGPHVLYRTFFDPIGDLVADEEPVVGDLADDLADIWRDLRGDHAMFAAHWGRHAAEALRVLHRLVLEGD